MSSSASPRRWSYIVAPAGFIVLAVSGYLLWGHFHNGPGHAHAHGEHASPAPTLNNGQRWATDAPLRLGMQRLRDAVAAELKAGNAANLSSAQSKALAATVQDTVTYLMQNCRLAPEADANLHLIINDLLAGAGLLTAGSPGNGVTKLTQALQIYARLFNHPDWHPLPAAPE